MFFGNFPPVLNTMLSEVEPLSDEENAQLTEKLASEWASKTLESLLAYAETKPSFGRVLCRKVTDKFGSNDELASLMQKRLKVDRTGKPKGPRRKWTKARYIVMLMHYEMRRAMEGREKALAWIGNSEGIGVNGRDGIFIPKKVEAKITAARKAVPETEWKSRLPPWAKGEAPLPPIE